MWILFLLVSIILSSATAILQKLVLKDKKVDSTAYAIFYQILTGFLLLAYAFSVGITFNGFYDKILNLFLMAILYGIGDVLIFKVIQKIDISDFTIIFQINAFFAVIFSSIFLNENLTNIQWFGFLLLLVGILVTLYEHRIVIHKYHLLTLLTAAILALAFINDAFILKTVNMTTYLAIAFLVPGFITLFFYPRAIKNLPNLFRGRNMFYLALASIFVALGAVLFFVSYKIISNAAQISSLAKLSTIIIVLFGIFFLNENQRRIQKIIGSSIALVGEFLLL